MQTDCTALLPYSAPAAVASRRAVRAGHIRHGLTVRADAAAVHAAAVAAGGVMRGAPLAAAYRVTDAYSASVRKFATNRAMAAAPASTRGGGSGTDARAIESVPEILGTAYIGAVEKLAAGTRLFFEVTTDGTVSPVWAVQNGKTREIESVPVARVVRRAIRRAVATVWPQDRTTDAARFVTRGVATRTDADGLPIVTGDVVAPRGIDAGTVAVLQAAAAVVLATGADLVSANGRPTVDVWRAVASAHGWGSGTAAVRRARETYGAAAAAAVPASGRKGSRAGGSAPDGTRYIGTARTVGTDNGTR